MTKYNTQGQEEYLLKSNLLGAQNMKELEQLERVAFYLSSSKIEEDGLDFLLPLSPNTVTILHKKLFGDLYVFGGEIRDKTLMKDKTRFCEPQFIEEQLSILCRAINNESSWNSVEEAAERLSYFKTELNMIHPFREGNGRTIRLVIREVAKSKGYDWSIDLMDNNEYMEAMISSQYDTGKLEKVFLKSLREF
ncbi:Fic/DOC family protein [Jeotgalicoccus sp. FSL K6-3177]|uniref:Fic/DOC family protein n=1 Tax=Jeotgalicoccus sp. FSL K6-3177 TaxID=2921494 RepID=UPI0030FDED2F